MAVENLIKESEKPLSCLVLGIGNILWADEGFGVRAVERFNELYEVEDENVKVEDGGTLGMFLLEPICRSKKLLILDCCDFHGRPAEMCVLKNDDIKIWASTKISPHQTGMNDILASAMMLGKKPEEICVVGMQPKLLDDYGGSLSPEIKAQLDSAAAKTKEILEEWGFKVVSRPKGSQAPKLSPSASLGIEAYEKDRPSEEEACRTGDERFFPRPFGGHGDEGGN